MCVIARLIWCQAQQFLYDHPSVQLLRKDARQKKTQLLVGKLISPCIHLDNFSSCWPLIHHQKVSRWYLKNSRHFNCTQSRSNAIKRLSDMWSRGVTSCGSASMPTISIYYFYSSAVYTQTWKFFFFFFSVRLFYIYASVFCSPPPYGMSACVCAERMWRMNGAARSQQLGHHPSRPASLRGKRE